jgi:hypothetical protein
LEFEKIPGGEDYWIAIEDNGIGMSEKTISRSLLDFGTSFWSSSAAAELYPGLPSEKKFKPTGKFGIGFFSIFMFASVVEVMSREFRSSSNIWNVLSFAHGIRGRANLSIESTPSEVKAPDASTRIKFRVNEKYLELLTESSPFARTEMESLSRERKIFGTLKDLVCALDVSVHLSYPNTDRLKRSSSRFPIWA